jgi:hydrogenase nickel incorporation protein HypB
MRKIEIIQNVLEANESIAAQNQRLLDKHNVFAINIMSSPGAGKTSLILQTLAKLKNKLRTAVIGGMENITKFDPLVTLVFVNDYKLRSC